MVAMATIISLGRGLQTCIAATVAAADINALEYVRPCLAGLPEACKLRAGAPSCVRPMRRPLAIDMKRGGWQDTATSATAAASSLGSLGCVACASP